MGSNLNLISIEHFYYTKMVGSIIVSRNKYRKIKNVIKIDLHSLLPLHNDNKEVHKHGTDKHLEITDRPRIVYH